MLQSHISRLVRLCWAGWNDLIESRLANESEALSSQSSSPSLSSAAHSPVSRIPKITATSCSSSSSNYNNTFDSAHTHTPPSPSISGAYNTSESSKHIQQQHVVLEGILLSHLGAAAEVQEAEDELVEAGDNGSLRHVSPMVKLHTSHLTPHTSHLAPRTSHLAPHTSHLTPHTSHLTPYISHLTPQTARHIAPSSSDILSSQLESHSTNY